MANLTLLTGRITRDLEIKQAGSAKVLRFSLAVENPFKKDDTSFFNIEAWEKQAELLAQYCGKGSKVLIEGNLKQDQFTDKDGNKREAVKVRANRIEFLDSKKDSQKQSEPNPFDSKSSNDTEFPF